MRHQSLHLTTQEMESSRLEFDRVENSALLTTLLGSDNGATITHSGDDRNPKQFFESTGIIALIASKTIQLPHSPKTEVRIDTVPYDVILHIFEYLSLCAKACLGVTCKAFYVALKLQHPWPISLFREVNSTGEWDPSSNICKAHSDSERLGFYLQDWSGLSKTYRLSKVPGCQYWIFVKMDIYGQEYDQYGNEWGMQRSTFNEGEDWYAKAVTVISADFAQPGSNCRPNDYKPWRDHWGVYYVFWEKLEEVKKITKNAEVLGARNSERDRYKFEH